MKNMPLVACFFRKRKEENGQTLTWTKHKETKCDKKKIN